MDSKRLHVTEFIVSTALINVLALVTPFFVIHVLNRYIAFGVDTTLATLVAGALLAVALEFGFREARVRLGTVFSNAFGDVRERRMVESFSQIRVFMLEAISSTTRIELARTPELIRQAVTPANLAAFADLPFAFLFIAVLFLISPPLALIASAVAMVVAVVALLIARSVARHQEAALRSVSARARLVSVMTGMLDTVRLYGARSWLQSRWADVAADNEIARDTIALRQGSLASVAVAAQALTSIGIISVGSVMVVQGNLDVGSMIGANILAARALGPVLRVAQMTEVVARARLADRHLREFATQAREVDQGGEPRDVSGAVEVEGLAFKWHNASRPLFNGLGFRIDAGQTAVIAGANGAGKTSLARILAGFIDPQGGDIRLDGIERRQLNPEWWREQIAYVPQQPTFLPGTLRDNLMIAGPDLVEGDLDRVIDNVGLRNFVDQSDGGLDMTLQADGSALSPGTRRRIALARALLLERAVVIVDEPAEALDIVGRKMMYQVLTDLRKAGRTLVLCTTDPALIKGADWVIDLNAIPHQVVDLNKARRSQERSQLRLAEPTEEAV